MCMCRIMCTYMQRYLITFGNNVQEMDLLHGIAVSMQMIYFQYFHIACMLIGHLLTFGAN